MIDAPFCNAVSLLTGFTGWVLAVWSFLRQASGAAIAGRILFVITLIFETMAVVSHHFAARDRT